MNAERGLSVVAIVTGIVALALSWQANQIAREANELAFEQLKSRIVVLDTQDGPSIYEANQLFCMQTVRLANLGAAPDSVVGYSAVIFLGDRHVTADSEGSSIAFNRDEIIPGIGDFFMRLIQAPDVWPSDIDQVETVDTPLKIDAYTTSDVTISFRYFADLAKYGVDSGYGWTNLTLQKTTPPAGYTPIEVTYTFEMASGQAAESPKFSCNSFKSD